MNFTPVYARYCSFKGCRSKSTDGIQIFRTPNNSRVKKFWQNFIYKSGHESAYNCANLKLCEHHFRPEDFERKNDRVKLKQGAIPTNSIVAVPVYFNELDLEMDVQEDPENYFKDICRLCRKSCSQHVHFSLSSSIDDLEIREILTHTIPIDFRDEINSKLPQIICESCITITSSAYELQKNAIKNDRNFREVIRRSKEDPVEVSVKSENYEEIKIEPEQWEEEKIVKEPEDLYEEHEIPLEILPADSSEVFVLETYDDSTELPKDRKEQPKICEELPKSLVIKSSYKSVGTLKLPEKLLPKPFSLKCQKCGRRFSKASTLEQHMEQHEAIEEALPTFYCDFCNETRRTKEEIEKHLLDAHARLKLIPKKSGRKQAIVCRKDSDSLLAPVISQGRLVHAALDADGNPVFICPVCAKILKSRNCLRQHIRMLHSDAKPQYKCKHCPMKFWAPSLLARHEKSHSSERPYVCKICGFAFKLLGSLQKHQRRHDGTMPKIPCSECEYIADSKDRLDQHMLTHSGKKPHSCEVCGRRYAFRGELMKHKSKAHLVDLSYKCEKCPKAFRLVVELREHQSEHVMEVEEN